MKTLLTLIVITTYQGLLFGQSDFNKNSYTSIDFSYFKYTSRNDRFYRRTNFFSSELQFKSNRHYLLGGININSITGEDSYSQVQYSRLEYGLKIGFGVYPYKNLKKIRIHHQINFYYELSANERQYRIAYLYLGNGLEYWINNKFTIGASLNIGLGYAKNTHVVGDGIAGYDQALLTLKYIFKEK